MGAQPVGDFDDQAGRQVGAAARGAAFVVPAVAIVWGVELVVGAARTRSAIFNGRTAGVFSRSVSVFGGSGGLRVAPVTFQSGGGPYADLTVMVNTIFMPTTEVDLSEPHILQRGGAEVRAGWLLSKSVPIDVAAGLAVYNIGPRSDASSDGKISMTVARIALGAAFFP